MMYGELSELTLRQKLGQIFMFGFDGHHVPPHVQDLLRDYRLGNIIYFRRNVSHSEQIIALSQELQQQSARWNSIPLSIAIDQEGGMVARIDRDVTVMPGQMTLGAAGSAKYAYDAGKISGMELAQLGITINFAPVLDVNNNPLNPVIGIRSFGEQPEQVAELGVSMISGYQEMGVAACAKHFPGHGDTTADSHEELPAVMHSLDRLHRIELVPFKAAVAAGVELIMTAHVQFPALEPDGKPATLSHRVLTELLREELGFESVIVTDCLEMKAISEGVGVGEGAVEAFKAGADLILVSHRLDLQLEAYAALEQAVLAGEISEERLNESVKRVLSMKQRQQHKLQQAKASSDFLPIGAAESIERCQRMMEQAVTLVQDQAGYLPLDRTEQTLVLWPEVRESTQVDEVIEQELTLGKQLNQLGLSTVELVIGTEPTEEELEQVVHMLQQERFGQIVMGMYNASSSSGQAHIVQLLSKLSEQQKSKVIFISLRNPYDRSLLSSSDTYICAYENRPQMLQALSLALVGSIPFQGKLPVQL